MRRAVVAVVGAVALAALPSSPALADTGIVLGPARQVITREAPVSVTIRSTSTEPVRVTADYWHAGTELRWTEGGNVLAFPEHFTLAPGEQREVTIRQTGPSRTTMLGVRFVLATAAAGSVSARGALLAELTAHPERVAPPASNVDLNQGFPVVLWFGSALVVLAAVIAGAALRRRRPRSSYGF